jgi:hypothetical protein
VISLDGVQGGEEVRPGPDVAQDLLGGREGMDGPLDVAVDPREVAHHSRPSAVGLFHEKRRADPLGGLLYGTITPESITFFSVSIAAAWR